MASNAKQRFLISYRFNGEIFSSTVKAVDEESAREAFFVSNPNSQIEDISKNEGRATKAERTKTEETGPNDGTEGTTAQSVEPETSYPADIGYNDDPEGTGKPPVVATLLFVIGWAVIVIAIFTALALSDQIDSPLALVSLIFQATILGFALIGLGKIIHYLKAIHAALKQSTSSDGAEN